MKNIVALFVFILLNLFNHSYGQKIPFDFKVDSEIIRSILADPDLDQKKEKTKYLISNDLISKEDLKITSLDTSSYFDSKGLELDLFSVSVLELIYELQSNIHIRQTPGPTNYVLEYAINNGPDYLSYLINTHIYGRVWQTTKSPTRNLRSTDIYVFSHFNDASSLFLNERLYTLLNLYLNQNTSLLDSELTFSTLIFQTESKTDWELYNTFGREMFSEWVNMDSYNRAYISDAPLFAYIFKVFHSKYFDLEEISNFINSTISNKQMRDEFASYLGTLIIYYKPELIYKYLETFWGEISNNTFYQSFSKTNPYSILIKKLDVQGLGCKNHSTIAFDILTGKFVSLK